MPPKRKQKLSEIKYNDSQNLLSEQLPEPRKPIVIEVDHSRKRMSLKDSQTDSLVLLSDGAPPSPNSLTSFIPITDGPASCSTYIRWVYREKQAKEASWKEASSGRDVEKRLAESAAESDRCTKEAKKAADDALEAEAQAKTANRLAYIELVKAQ